MDNKNSLIKLIENLYSEYEKDLALGKVPDFNELQYLILENQVGMLADIKKAVEIAEQGLKQYPDSFLLKIALARKYVTLDLLDKAKPLILELDFVSPDLPQMHIAKGAYLLKTGKMEDGIAELEQAIDLAEDHTLGINAISTIGLRKDPAKGKGVVLHETGIALLEVNLPKKAIPYLKRAIELSEKTNFLPKTTLAACYNQLGNPDKAIQIYNDILRETPFLINVWIALAELYLQIEDYDNTIDACKYALAIDETNFQARLVLAKAYFGKGEYEESINLLMEISDSIKDKDQMYLHFCEVYTAMEDFENLEKYGLKIIEIHPESHWGYFHTSNALFNQLKWEEVIPYAEKLMEFDSDSEDLLFYFSIACMKTKQEQKAIDMLKCLLEINPDYPEIMTVYTLLVNAYNRMGDEEKAREYFEKARIIDPSVKSPFRKR